MNYAEWPKYVRKKYALSNSRIGSTDANEPTIEAETVVKWLYDVLTTLDAKASALMRLNGVLIAAAAFLLGMFGRVGSSVLARDPRDAKLIIVSAVLSAISIFACLFVVRVSWAFLGKLTLGAGPQTCDFKEEILSLARACAWRERTYQLAWYISALASIGFIAEFVLQAIHVFTVGGKAG